MALKVSNVIRPAVRENLFLQTVIQPKRVTWMILILIFYQRIITRVSNYIVLNCDFGFSHTITDQKSAGSYVV